MSDHPTLPFDEAGEPEEWRPVVGYEGLYAISDQGRVRSFGRHAPRKSGGILKLTPVGEYHTVCLYRGGEPTTRMVHVLVAEAFLGLRPEGLFVRHGRGGPRDNRPANLSYGTPQENSLDMYRDGTILLGEAKPTAKLTDDAVVEIRARHAAGESMQALADEFGVSRAAIGYAVRRETWKHVA